MKACLLSDNVDKFFEINSKFIYSFSKQYDGLDLINYGQQEFDKFHGFNVENIRSLYGIFKYFSKGDLVCIIGMNDSPSEWFKYFILRVTNTRLIRITSISTVCIATFNSSNFLLQIKQKIIFFLYILLLYLKVLPKIDLYLTSNFKEHWSNKYKYKQIEVINSIHCDEVIDNLGPITEEYIVFLDSNLPFHQDQSKYGYEKINPEDYYKQLNFALDSMSEKFSKPVVVCLHPKFDVNLSNKYFPEKKTSRFNTFKYSKKAFLVVFHESSSINYSILLKKPIVQLYSNDFNKMITTGIDVYKEALGIKSLDMKSFLLSKDICRDVLSIDYDKYEKFINENLCRYHSKKSSIEGLSVYNIVQLNLKKRQQERSNGYY